MSPAMLLGIGSAASGAAAVYSATKSKSKPKVAEPKPKVKQEQQVMPVANDPKMIAMARQRAALKKRRGSVYTDKTGERQTLGGL